MGIDLDHVAIGTDDVGPILDVMVGEMGAGVLWGGNEIGFRAMQLDCGDMRVELLEPHDVHVNDFLERFLARSGQGPHHITFKTDDIRDTLASFEEAGYTPVGVNLGNPWWQEAFIHPKQSGPTVIQLAESAVDPQEMIDHIDESSGWGPTAWWPDPPERAAEHLNLRRVVLSVAELERRLEMFVGLLGASEDSRGEGYVDLCWPGGRLRLLDRPDDRPRVECLEWDRGGWTGSERTVGGALFRFTPPAAAGATTPRP